MKRTLMVAAVLLCIAVVGFAAGAKKTIAFIPTTLENEHYMIEAEGAKQEAAKLGVNIIVQAGSRHADVEEQLTIIEDMIAKKVDAICLSATDTTGVISVIEKALRAKIPVVIVDSDIDHGMLTKEGYPDVPFIGSNNYDGAKMIAKYALDNLGMAGAKVALLSGPEGSQASIDRLAGFIDATKGKVDVVTQQTANYEVEQGYTVFQNILQAHPEVNFLFAVNDNMAIGAIRAIKEANRNDITVLGYDAIPAALDLVEKGDMKATLAQLPADMGAKGIDTALELIKGKKVAMSTFTQLKVIPKEEVASFRDYLKKFIKSNE